MASAAAARLFYALDVTDPTNPTALWEFGTAQDADLGYSYGNPILTKRASDGKWVVLFASGYNNTGGRRRAGCTCSTRSPARSWPRSSRTTSVNDPDLSGIAKISNWVLNTLVDNSTQYVYGGDLGGATCGASTFPPRRRSGSADVGHGRATSPSRSGPKLRGSATRPATTTAAVYFGTGRYLGFGDLVATAPSSTVAQAIYAVKDTGTDLGVLTSAGAKLVAQTVDSSGDPDGLPRTIPNPVAVDWQSKNGWYVNTPVGERVNVDLKLQLGTLVAVSNKPDDDYCFVGGKSWLFALDYRTGAAVQGQQTTAVGFPIGASIATGVTLVRLPTNKLIAIVTQADTTVRAMGIPVAPGAATGVRRMGWREIN